ncbi:unnamed protein product [Clonostachys solani]|uniref:FAD dependent oxidoreductase domain-containing protein n=1 Tax=Clonostachys solani TaxID=160281 RepID=A0A9N9YXL6_9HYPO|nr:unnamed protein product [Clonostachys solani]
MNDKNKQILIVGGGTFGLSTAYHLAKSGYTSVSVLERSSFIPAEESPGNDVNKIIRAEYEDPRYAQLALEAIDEWTNNPLFAPYYHQVGCPLCNSLAALDKAKRTLAKSLSSISKHPACAGKIAPINSREDTRKTYARDDEPDPRTNLLNLCPSGAGITNFNMEGVSLPPGSSPYIPPHDEEASRRILRETLRALAEPPLVHKKMCWVADTDDSDYLIACVPGTEGLIVASGDSGHRFKMLTMVGGWIRRVVEDGQQVEARWRWKPGRGRSRDNVSWRVGELYDLGEEKTRSRL